MKTFLKTVLIILFTFISGSAFAVEDLSVEKNVHEGEILLPENTQLPERDFNNDGVIDNKDLLIDTAEENFFMFKHLGDPIDREEGSLFYKVEKALKDEVTRTDYSNYLLKDILTVDLYKGPVDRIQFYGKYRGNLSFNFMESDYDADYDVTSIDVGMMGQLNPL